MALKHLTVIDSEVHRNGVGGSPFTVALVEDSLEGDTKLVVMFEAAGHTAVLSLDKLIESRSIRFGDNSYRGDIFEEELAPELRISHEPQESMEISDL